MIVTVRMHGRDGASSQHGRRFRIESRQRVVRRRAVGEWRAPFRRACVCSKEGWVSTPDRPLTLASKPTNSQPRHSNVTIGEAWLVSDFSSVWAPLTGSLPFGSSKTAEDSRCQVGRAPGAKGGKGREGNEREKRSSTSSVSFACRPDRLCHSLTCGFSRVGLRG